jgi:Cys-tRNA(Pro)/Cys-tRNA(Cys) deacylase
LKYSNCVHQSPHVLEFFKYTITKGYCQRNWNNCILLEQPLFLAPVFAIKGKITDMSNFPPAAQALADRKVPFRLFVHSKPVNSLVQAAEERAQVPDQVVRSILFRISEDHFVMVLIGGPAQISWPKLRTYLGQSRLTLATEEEVLAVTGYRVGAVSPFGLPKPLRTLADEKIFQHTEISIGSGVRGTALILNSHDLRSTLADIEVGQFAELK